MPAELKERDEVPDSWAAMPAMQKRSDAIPGTGDSECPAEYLWPRWYAAYTAPRHEKYVTQQMDGRRIHCFLPLYRSVRRWKDRRMQVELPLFPGYVFVHLALRDRLQVLQLPGVVQLVSFSGKPAALPDARNRSSAQRVGGQFLRGAASLPYGGTPGARSYGIGGGARRHSATPEAEVPGGAFDSVDPALGGHRSR